MTPQPVSPKGKVQAEMVWHLVDFHRCNLLIFEMSSKARKRFGERAFPSGQVSMFLLLLLC